MILTTIGAQHQTTALNAQVETLYSKSMSSYEYAGIQTETASPLTKGDHVHALPYTSTVRYEQGMDIPWVLEAFNGSIFLANGTRKATRADWPWPVQTKGKTNTVRKLVWSHNLGYQCSVPNQVLPTLPENQWLLLEQLADTKALGNLRKALLNLPMLFAERRETLRLIGDKARTIAKMTHDVRNRSLDEFRRMKPKDKKAGANRIANEHLAFVFGVLPLISEVEGAIELFSRDSLDFIRSRGIQAIRNTTPLVQDPVNGVLPRALEAGSFGNHPWFIVYSHGRRTDLTSVRTALRYKLTTKAASNLYALGFEPIGTAFDLVPLSFVSGWISNFDYWVRTISPEVGVEFETGSRNRRSYTESQMNYQAITQSANFDIKPEVKKAAWNGNYRKDVRKVLAKAPEATLHWDVDVGLFEVAASISLAVQRYLPSTAVKKASRHFRYRGPRPKWLKTIRYTGRR